jgi:hypothetical protein
MPVRVRSAATHQPAIAARRDNRRVSDLHYPRRIGPSRMRIDAVDKAVPISPVTPEVRQVPIQGT